MTMRELPPQDELLKPRDHEPIVVVPPQTWHCLFCEPRGRGGAGTTVEWVGPGVDGADGRCRKCGQKYCLASGSTMPLRAGMPARHASTDPTHCEYCTPAPPAESPPTVTWRNGRGYCERCGQRYLPEAA